MVGPAVNVFATGSYILVAVVPFPLTSKNLPSGSCTAPGPRVTAPVATLGPATKILAIGS